MMAAIARMMAGLALMLMIAPTAAQAADQRKPTTQTAAAASAAAPPPIPYQLALVLIRAHLAALQQADETGNYQVLSALGSASFQAANPPQKLAQMFTPMRAWNINAVLVTEPKFAELPHLTDKGLMAMRGQFAIDSKVLQFTLIFQPEGGHWRMFGIGAEVH